MGCHHFVSRWVSYVLHEWNFAKYTHSTYVIVATTKQDILKIVDEISFFSHTQWDVVFMMINLNENWCYDVGLLASNCQAPIALPLMLVRNIQLWGAWSVVSNIA